MPLWVHAKLAKLIFPFFWKWKPDLVAQDVVTQPPTAGGFPVVNIKLKVVPCWFSGYGATPPPRPAGRQSFFSGFLINYMLLLTLSWPTRSLFILAFCPPAIVPCCLPGGKSKDRILNAAPLLSLLHFPLIIAVLLLRPPLSMFTNFYCLRAARPPPPPLC